MWDFADKFLIKGQNVCWNENESKIDETLDNEHLALFVIMKNLWFGLIYDELYVLLYTGPGFVLV